MHASQPSQNHDLVLSADTFSENRRLPVRNRRAAYVIFAMCNPSFPELGLSGQLLCADMGSLNAYATIETRVSHPYLP